MDKSVKTLIKRYGYLRDICAYLQYKSLDGYIFKSYDIRLVLWAVGQLKRGDGCGFVRYGINMDVVDLLLSHSCWICVHQLCGLPSDFYIETHVPCGNRKWVLNDKYKSVVWGL